MLEKRKSSINTKKLVDGRLLFAMSTTRMHGHALLPCVFDIAALGGEDLAAPDSPIIALTLNSGKDWEISLMARLYCHVSLTLRALEVTTCGGACCPIIACALISTSWQ